jgi:hypothetical protein
LAWIALAAAGLTTIGVSLHDDETSGERAMFQYQDMPAGDAAACPTRPGTDLLRTPRGIAVTVRGPANYDWRHRHPLLVVYAPASSNRISNERFTKLTHVATAAGLIIAYADHAPMTMLAVDDLGSIPDLLRATGASTVRASF